MRQLYQLFLLTGLFQLSGCTTAPAQAPPAVINNQFQAVWEQVNSGIVERLPQQTVSFGKLFSGGKDIILGNSRRTLDEHANIIPTFNKLAHPNGICFKGVWNIQQQNKYSGYFKKNSKALIIVRASTALSSTRRGKLRAFGFAGKIFPTLNPLQPNLENTANFFLIDDLGGTRAEHFTDVTLTNEPDVSKTSAVFKSLLYALKVARTFSQVDKRPGIRQVYEISQLGEPNKSNIITPQWMKVAAQPGQSVDAADFRDELRITNNKKLVFIVSVASEQTNDKKNWQEIGTITLNTSVVSQSCDHRLHFHHPKWRSDLKH